MQMDHVVSIIKSETNNLDFDVNIEGLSADVINVRFVIEAEDVDLTFHCKKMEGDKWGVAVPPVEMIQTTAYPFRIEVVAEGYFFTPMRGMVNVVRSPEVYTSAPKHVIEPPKNTTTQPERVTPVNHMGEGEKKVEKKVEKVLPKKKIDIKRIVDEAVKKPVVKKVEKKPVVKKVKKVVEKKVEKKLEKIIPIIESKKAAQLSEKDQKIHDILNEKTDPIAAAKKAADKILNKPKKPVVKKVAKKVEKKPVVEKVEEKKPVVNEGDAKVKNILDGIGKLENVKEEHLTPKKNSPIKKGGVVVH